MLNFLKSLFHKEKPVELTAEEKVKLYWQEHGNPNAKAWLQHPTQTYNIYNCTCRYCGCFYQSNLLCWLDNCGCGPMR